MQRVGIWRQMTNVLDQRLERGDAGQGGKGEAGACAADGEDCAEAERRSEQDARDDESEREQRPTQLSWAIADPDAADRVSKADAGMKSREAQHELIALWTPE